jgi:MFS family permease
MTKNRSRAVLVAMGMAYALAMFHRTAFPEIASDVTASAGLSQIALGALGSAFFWAYLLFQIPAGILVDSFGARRVSACGSFAMFVGSALFASVSDPLAMAAARGLTAAGAVSAFLALAAFCNQAYGRKSSSAVGIGMLIGNLGGIAAGIPLAFALTLMDWREAWWVVSCASALAGLATLRLAPQDEPRSAPLASMLTSVRVLRLALRNSDVYLGAGALAGLAGAFYAFAGFGVHMSSLSLHLGSEAEGGLVSAMLLGFAGGSWIWGRAGDSLRSRARVARVAPIAAMGLWLALFAWTPPSVWALGALLFGIGLACSSCAVLYAMLDELATAEARGAFKAAANCGIALGASVAQVSQGILPHPLAAFPSLVLAAVGAGCCWALANRCRDTETTIGSALSADEETPATNASAPASDNSQAPGMGATQNRVDPAAQGILASQ